MILVIDAKGGVQAIYAEIIDLKTLGALAIRRASHVEPDELGQWWADLAPMFGPKFGPFACRSEALDAEKDWLEAWLVGPS